MRIFKKDLININDLKEEIRYIKDSDNYYISENGNVYHRFGDMVYKKKLEIHPTGYVYSAISYNGKQITKRVHKLVAIAFIPNPNNYEVIHHKNNIKTVNRVSNLEWCTISYNTKKSFDEGFSKNDKGYEDSQSFPVIMYNSINHNEISKFGSIGEASRQMGYSKSTIARQCKLNHPARKNIILGMTIM